MIGNIEPVTVRNASDIQRAHDILTAVILGEIPGLTPTGTSKTVAIVALDVLCWVLQHDHNKTFAINLAAIENAANSLGYELRKIDDLGDLTNERHNRSK